MNTEIVRAVTSSSNLHQRELCPGSAAAEEGLPNEESEYSAEGTFLHALDAQGEVYDEQPTDEQRHILKAAAEADESIFRAVTEKMDISQDEPFIEGRETEVWLRRGFKSLFPGHPDRWRYYSARKILIVIDKKFGYREVTAAEINRQLMSYGVMVAEDYDADHVFVAINQPRLPAMLRVTIGEFSREKLAQAKQLIFQIWDGAHNPDGSTRKDVPRVAGDDQCRYCKAKLNCDAYQEKYVFLAKASEDGKKDFVAKLATLADDELDRIYVACKFAGLVEDPAKEEILRRMAAGGMQHYQTQGNGFASTITDNYAALGALKDAGLPVDKIARPLSNSDLKVVMAGIKGISQVDADKQIKAILAPYVESKPKAPSLKRTNLLK